MKFSKFNNLKRKKKKVYKYSYEYYNERKNELYGNLTGEPKTDDILIKAFHISLK